MPDNKTPGHLYGRFFLICRFVLFLTVTSPVLAGTLEQAKRLHERLTGISPSATTLAAMKTHLDNGEGQSAANLAMEHRAFYEVTLKTLASPWTNEEQSVYTPLNDYSATVIGLVRDDEDFRQILYGDVIYTGSGAGIPAYSNNNNNHYQKLDELGINLKDNLQKQTQSAVTGLPAAATAGIITSRAAAKAFFKDGTNRAMLRFTLINHLCTDLEGLKDSTRAPDRIRQDVTRSPGGDSRIFLNNCAGCHTGMDPLAQAFAYYNWEYNSDTDPNGEAGHLDYNTATDPATGTRVQAKYLINQNNFKPGFITLNDNWSNYWRAGKNALLGWDSNLPGQGQGVKSMGRELANSHTFAQCQVKNIFKAVCLRPISSQADSSQVDTTTSNFISSGYQLKRVFADIGLYCMGD